MSEQDQLLQRKMLGAKLRKTRKERGKSLKETAALVGTTTGKLSAYERGERIISLPELEMFAYQFEEGVEPDLLVLGKSISGGLPLSACVAKAEIADASSPGTESSTASPT